MKKGYIYIMTNPSFSDKVKIGFTGGDVEKRRKQLSKTNVPDEFEVYATYETSGNLEDKKLHRLIDKLNPDLRYNTKKEFYIMSPEDAFELLESIATISGTLDKLNRFKNPDSKRSMRKRPAINFAKCNIPVGAKLVFTEDPSVVCTVENDRKVRYKDEITSLSAIAKDYFGKKTSEGVRGPHYFTYNGELISDIAKNTQWRDDV